MTAKSTVIALLSAALFLGTSAATATFAVDADRAAPRSASDPSSCPPEACSVVIKTAGGEPSRILAPAVAPKTDPETGLVLVADALD